MTAGLHSRHARPRPRQLRRLAGGVTVLAAAIVSEAVGAGALTAQAADRSVVLIDNSHADSWLEVDRAGNQQLGSGISGSDLDGAATDLTSTVLHPVIPGGKPHRPVPEERDSPEEDAAVDREASRSPGGPAHPASEGEPTEAQAQPADAAEPAGPPQPRPGGGQGAVGGAAEAG
ncbi:hypothetical protein [Streptomyces sp. NPDC093589]|uniref:hypothetical protein n=1 Tax=Streptomyces sp. NPDC093589 TaxID=3366043 RepID=UPI003821CE54